MALPAPDELPVDEDDLAPLEDLLSELAGAGRGAWVNLVPEVEPGTEPPPRRATIAIFSSRGDAVPLATWKAPDRPGRRATLGIEHGSGPKALARLAEADLPLPSGWLKVGDHPKRGLVVTVPPEAEVDAVVWWLLSATHVLSVPPLTGSWLAHIYRPS